MDHHESDASSYEIEFEDFNRVNEVVALPLPQDEQRNGSNMHAFVTKSQETILTEHNNNRSSRQILNQITENHLSRDNVLMCSQTISEDDSIDDKIDSYSEDEMRSLENRQFAQSEQVFDMGIEDEEAEEISVGGSINKVTLLDQEDQEDQYNFNPILAASSQVEPQQQRATYYQSATQHTKDKVQSRQPARAKKESKHLSRKSSKTNVIKNVISQEEESKRAYGHEPLSFSQDQYSSHKVLKTNNEYKSVSNYQQNFHRQQTENSQLHASMSAKSTKSKTRMIKNILQTSNLNINAHSNSKLPLKQHPLTSQHNPNFHFMDGFTDKHVELCAGISYMTPNHEQAANNAFDSLIDGFKADFLGFSNSKSKPNPQYIRDKFALQKSAVIQKYQSQINSLKQIKQKLLAKKTHQIDLVQETQARLEIKLDQMGTKAKMECDLVRSREQLRVWRNVTQLTQSWVYSILTEAEKQNVFAKLKEAKTVDKIVFQSEEFQGPQTATSKKDVNKSATQGPSRFITQSEFAESQLQEVYKFLGKVHTKNQQLIEFKLKPLVIVTEKDQFTHSQRKIPIQQKVSDFAVSILSQHEDNPISDSKRNYNLEVVEMSPLAVMHGSEFDMTEPAFEETRLEMTKCFSELPSMRQALQSFSNLPSKKLKVTKTLTKRQLQQIVSNQVLDILNGPKSSRRDKRIFVCLKDVKANGLELRSEAEMVKRMQNNKTMEKVFTSAIPIAQCIRKYQSSSNDILSAKCAQIKQIKGLNQLKVEFDQKEYAILAEVDVQMLMQTKEFTSYFSQAADQRSIHLATSTVKVYVIEECSEDTGDVMPRSDTSNSLPKSKIVRQLQPIEVLFLIRRNVQIASQLKVFDFILNLHEAQNWHGIDQIGGLSTLQGRKQTIQPDGRSSLTITSIHDDIHHDDKDEKSMTEGTSQLQLLKQRGLEVRYVLVDERSKSGANAGQLLKRYIFKAHVMPRNEVIPVDKLDIVLCNWPSCMHMTKQQMIQPGSQKQELAHVPKKRPDSAYSRKNNQSSTGFASEKQAIKRVGRLRIGFDFELNENAYGKFIKRPKLTKEKQKFHSQNQTNVLQPFVMRQALDGVLQVAPILSTIQSNTNQSGNNTTSGYQSNIQNLCCYHQQLDRYVTVRFSITLVPGPLNCNNFFKGLKNFDNWKLEAKNSLINDLFVIKTEGRSNQVDTFLKIQSYALGQVNQVSGPDIIDLIRCLQQIPKSINFPEKFFQWLIQFVHTMSPLMVKNAQFKDAVSHFQFQLAPLSANLKQVKLNEDFIITEMKRWIVYVNPAQKSFLKENYNFLINLVHTKDVINRFTTFQQFLNKLNSLSGMPGSNSANSTIKLLTTGFGSEIPSNNIQIEHFGRKSSSNNQQTNPQVNFSKMVQPYMTKNPPMQLVSSQMNTQSQTHSSGFGFGSGPVKAMSNQQIMIPGFHQNQHVNNIQITSGSQMLAFSSTPQAMPSNQQKVQVAGSTLEKITQIYGVNKKQIPNTTNALAQPQSLLQSQPPPKSQQQQMFESFASVKKISQTDLLHSQTATALNNSSQPRQPKVREIMSADIKERPKLFQITPAPNDMQANRLLKETSQQFAASNNFHPTPNQIVQSRQLNSQASVQSHGNQQTQQTMKMNLQNKLQQSKTHSSNLVENQYNLNEIKQDGIPVASQSMTNYFSQQQKEQVLQQQATQLRANIQNIQQLKKPRTAGKSSRQQNQQAVGILASSPKKRFLSKQAQNMTNYNGFTAIESGESQLHPQHLLMAPSSPNKGQNPNNLQRFTTQGNVLTNNKGEPIKNQAFASRRASSAKKNPQAASKTNLAAESFNTSNEQLNHQRYSILSVSKGNSNASGEDQQKNHQQYGITAKDWVLQKNGNKIGSANKNPQNVSNLMVSKPLPHGKAKNNRKESLTIQRYQTDTGVNQKFEAASSSGFTQSMNNQPIQVQKSGPNATQPPKVPQIMDSRTNVSGGIKITNSVLTPSHNSSAQAVNHQSRPSQGMFQSQTTFTHTTGSVSHTNYTSGCGNVKKKQAGIQVTYANAMPRLASANAYLSKQARKLKPGPSAKGQLTQSGFQSSQSVKSSSRVIRQIPPDQRGQIFNEPVILAHNRANSKSKPTITDQIQTNVDSGYINPGSRSVATSNINAFQKQYIIQGHADGTESSIQDINFHAVSNSPLNHTSGNTADRQTAPIGGSRGERLSSHFKKPAQRNNFLGQ